MSESSSSDPILELETLLTLMSPAVIPGEFVFVTVPESMASKLPSCASILEPEGLSLVLRKEDAEAANLEFDYVAGWITLSVHSGLDAVGLTAAVATALAAVGLSCNVIAGFHHDHLFVPYDRRDEAVAILQELQLTV